MPSGSLDTKSKYGVVDAKRTLSNGVSKYVGAAARSLTSAFFHNINIASVESLTVALLASSNVVTVITLLVANPVNKYDKALDDVE